MAEKASMREQIRVYKSTLRGDQLAEFNRVFNEQSETKAIKKAFVAAREAAAKAKTQGDVEAWAVVEVKDDGTEDILGVVRMPNAKEQAETRAERIRNKEGKTVKIIPYLGEPRKHYGT